MTVHPSAIPVSAAPAAAPAAIAPTPRLWLAASTLWKREIVRFLRQRSRVIGALVTPLVFWLLLGSGLDRTFNMSGEALNTSPVGYLQYSFPGIILMMVLFTAIFSTISVIEDRREGFLQGVLVAPVSRLALVLGKVLGGATLALLQSLPFLLLWPFVGHWPGAAWMLLAAVELFLIGCGLTALGLCIAWPMDSTAGFHAIMNLFLMPMWFLSGAVFPLATARGWIKPLMWANPMTYSQAAFAQTMAGGENLLRAPLPLWPALALSLLWTVIFMALAVRIVSKIRKDGR